MNERLGPIIIPHPPYRKKQDESGRYICDPTLQHSPLTQVLQLQSTIGSARADITNWSCPPPQKARANPIVAWSWLIGVSGECCSVGSQIHRPLSSCSFRCGGLEMMVGPSLSFMLLAGVSTQPPTPNPPSPFSLDRGLNLHCTTLALIFLRFALNWWPGMWDARLLFCRSWQAKRSKGPRP